MNMVGRLCAICQGIFDAPLRVYQLRPWRGHTPPPEYLYPHHPTVTKLRISSERCHFCTLLYSRLGSAKLTEKIMGIVFDNSLQIWIINSGEPVETELRISDTKDRDPAITRKLHHCLGSSTEHESSFQIAREWISNCIKNHPQCTRQGSRKDWFPTRIIDVGNGDTLPRLLISSVEHHGKPYITLSHCWGSKILPQNAQLTRNTLERFQTNLVAKGIWSLDFPKTFLDAIMISRRLGIQYLWVDALCIFQDSREDWAIESAKMRDVYANSYLTIAATGARDSTEGCFRERNILHLLPCPVQARISAGDVKHLYIHEKVVSDRHIRYWMQIQNSILMKRAWYLQERILSPRILHYTSNQLVWECLTRTMSESLPEGSMFWKDRLDPTNVQYEWYDTRTTSLSDQWLKMILLEPSRETRPWLDLEEITGRFISWRWSNAFVRYLDWEYLLRSYSQSNLTMPTDKLIAIAGLAEEWSVILRDEFIAGLWRRDFVVQLLWQVISQKGPTISRVKINNQYRAPSWSWASIDAPIKNEAVSWRIRDQFFPAATILDVSVSFHEDKGAVGCCSGYVIVAGRAFEATYSKKGGGKYALRPFEDAGVTLLENLRFSFSFDVDFAAPGPEETGEMLVDIVTCLYICSRRGSANSHYYYCLILKKESKDYIEGRAVYTRVGVLEVETIETGGPWFQKYQPVELCLK